MGPEEHTSETLHDRPEDRPAFPLGRLGSEVGPLAYITLSVLGMLALGGLFVYYTPMIYPIQVLETRIIHAIVQLFGVNVVIAGDGITLNYPPPLYGVRTGPDCTGVLEMFLMVGLVLGFIGPKIREMWRHALKWILILASVIFGENILRQVLNYPIALAYGYAQWRNIHYMWWKHGQFVFLIVLFVLWYMLIYRRHMGHSKAGDGEYQNMGDNGKRGGHRRGEPQKRGKRQRNGLGKTAKSVKLHRWVGENR